MAAAAAKSLRSWPGVNYSGTVVDGGGVVTRVRVTVTRDGTAYGTLSREFGALAEIAVAPGRTLLRGNRQWWLGERPGSADSLADLWIADPPQGVMGMAPVSQLTPAAVADVTFPASADAWAQAGVAPVNGRPALALTNGTQQILVSASAPHRLLSIGVPLGALPSPGLTGTTTSSAPGTTPALASLTSFGAGHPSIALAVTAGPGGTEVPAAVSAAVSEATDAQVQDTGDAVKQLGEAQVGPAKLADIAKAQPAVTLRLSDLSGNPCTTPTCSVMVTADNAGPGTAKGRLLVTVAGQTPLDTAVSVGAGSSLPYVATATNTAPADTTIYETWLAVLYDAAIMGDDPELVKRVADRGFSVNTPAVADQPNGKAVLQVLEAMTPDIGPSTSAQSRAERVKDVTSIVSSLIQHRAFAPFYEMAIGTDNLSVAAPTGIREMRDTAAQLSSPGQLRVLQHAANLTTAGHKITWNTTYHPPGSAKGYKANILDLTTQQAIQEVTVDGGTNEVQDRFRALVKEFQNKSTTVAPPDFAKVAWLNVAPNATTPMVGMPRDALLNELRKLDLHRLCAPDGGPVVDHVVITNYPPDQAGAPEPTTNVFTCADLQLGAANDLRKQILNEQTWKAENDPGWLNKYYESDGTRRSVNNTEHGFPLPVMSVSNRNTFTPKSALPAGPAPVRVNPLPYDRTTANPEQLTRLDQAALNRNRSVALTNAAAAYELDRSVENLRALTTAQKEYRAVLGDQSNNTGIAAQFGEDAARYHVIPRAFPDFKWTELPKTPNNANMFDQLYERADGSFVIVEAKAPNGKLSPRLGAGEALGLEVQQGTKGYVQTIIALMAERAKLVPEDGRLAGLLAKALEDGKLEYVLVTAHENPGRYEGATLEHFKI
ncbi:hypothetical protein ACFV4P_31340 [Kitasatospora sp. NPDC059795]|uniref:hypothetical protein n=1 Tax=Kitasatospora sp. NPDC059795 TaxID=3346949 RepID=UPI003666F099